MFGVLKKKLFGFRFSNPTPDSKVARQSAARFEGDRWRDQRRWREAAAAYERHLTFHPDDFAIWVQLGHAHKESGHTEEAANAYKKALAIDPDDADLLAHCGYLLQRRNAIPPTGSLDSFAGTTACGWVMDDGSEPPEVQLFQAGRLVGFGAPTLTRSDLQLAGSGDLLLGFEIPLDLDFTDSDTVEVTARLKRTGQLLANSPVRVSVPQAYRSWMRRNAGLAGDELALVRAAANRHLAGRLSIVMPVYEARPEWLHEAIGSVVAQWCDAWELICVDDHSSDPRVRETLFDYAKKDSRIKVILLDRNHGIAGATNQGIAAASGDYIGFLDHDDMLEPEAVARILQAAMDGAELLYSDEVLTGQRLAALRQVVARPAFSYDYYLSHPYFVHFVAVKADVARAVSGWDETMAISADVDFMLRVIERSRKVTHVPAVLYRWRTHEGSAGHAKMDAVTQATVRALNRHLQRTGQPALARAGVSFNSYRIDWQDDAGPTAIIIPTKNRQDLLRVAIESIRKTCDNANVDIVVIDHASDDPAFHAYLAELGDTIRVVRFAGPFNFAAMNNQAVASLGDKYRYLLFANNDIEAVKPGWLEHMRGLCRRPDVGVVGATLLYPDKRIQHAGVVLGLNGLADHAHKFRPFETVDGARNPGYNISLLSVRDYSAVTAACMMIRTELFREMGGFDEEFTVGFNDTDLCLRLGKRGYAVLNDPYAVLYHHESATRAGTHAGDHPEDGARLRERWDGLINGDLFYSPLLNHVVPHDHGLAFPERAFSSPRTRSVRSFADG